MARVFYDLSDTLSNDTSEFEFNKHEITYLKPTFLQDIVVAEVIAEKVQGARAMFRTVLRRGEDVLSEIHSSWCCLDAASLRPARLAREVVRRFLPTD